jgi:hypothetical protein
MSREKKFLNRISQSGKASLVAGTESDQDDPAQVTDVSRLRTEFLPGSVATADLNRLFSTAGKPLRKAKAVLAERLAFPVDAMERRHAR